MRRHFRKQRRSRLSNQLLSAIGTAVLLPLLILLLVLIPLARREASQSWARKFEDQARLLAVGVSQLLEQAKGDVRRLVNREPVRIALDDQEHLDQALRFLHQYFLDAEGRFHSLEIQDRKGKRLGGVGEIADPDTTAATERAAPTTRSPRQIQLERIQPGPSAGSVLLHLSAPLLDASGEITGRLVASLDAFRITAQVRHARPGREGRAFLVDHHGNVLTPLPGDSDEPLHEGVRNLIRAGHPHSDFLPLHASQTEEHLVAMAPVPDPDTLSLPDPTRVELSVVATSPLAPIMAGANGQIRPLVYAAAAVVVFLLVWISFLAKRVSLPLRQLAEEVRRFERQDGDHGEPVHPEPSDPNDEVEQLRAAFEAMANRVEGHQGKLEQRADSMETMLQKLRQADALKDEFLAFLSHEVRTPLSSIRAFAEILRTCDNVSAQESGEFLGIIETECDRLTLLCNDLLDLARIDSGEMPWRDSKLDIAEVIQAVIRTASVTAERRHIHLFAQYEPDLPPLTADRDRMVQVLINLVSNALKFTPSGGQITVRAALAEAADPAALELSVLDTGPGIPTDYLDKIFDPYVQAPEDRQDAPIGSGLGLTICTRVVLHYGGVIRAANQPTGGAAITITWPLEPPHVVSPTAPAAAAC